MRSHNSLGGSVEEIWCEESFPGVMARSGPLAVGTLTSGPDRVWSTGSPGMPGLVAQPVNTAISSNMASKTSR